jgi:hypothetical protein
MSYEKQPSCQAFVVQNFDRLLVATPWMVPIHIIAEPSF